jgi:AcrR family transcriptional regulator
VLVDTATAMLAEGDTGFTLREVARRAGVSPAAPYNHFTSKGALIAAVAAHGLTRFRAMLGRSLARHRGAPPEAQAGALIDAYIRFAFASPAQFDVIFGPEAVAHRTPELHGEAERTKDVLRALLTRWQTEGLVAPGDLDERVRLTWSAAHGLATLLRGPIALDVPTQEQRRTLAHAAARLLLRGLRAAD